MPTKQSSPFTTGSARRIVARIGVAPQGEAVGPATDPLNLYIHWPFCLSKCPYCDFNSHVADSIDRARWRRAMIREIETFAAETVGRSVASVFFGGGTPSLMDPGDMAAVIGAVRASWSTDVDCEITLEANPTSSEAGRFRGFREAGVNRLSIGVQSFDDAVLRFLGRSHAAADAIRAIEAGLAVCERVSFDLIYAVPGQTTADWSRQLDQALSFPVRHLSVYQLTVAPGTAFHREGVAEADPETGAELFELTQERLGAAGFPAYEISNHAAPGHECRHNRAIWRGQDYLPIGPGAEGRLRRAEGTDALNQHRLPQRWLEAVEAKGTGLARRKRLQPAERQSELVILGLRLADGIERKQFFKRTGVALDGVVDASERDRLIALGLIAADEQRLRATPAGRQRLDWVLGRILG
jgi:oxygen-independent coproporphyrinogen-3 oxidase